MMMYYLRSFGFVELSKAKTNIRKYLKNKQLLLIVFYAKASRLRRWRNIKPAVD